jgi:hypothetical protein
VTRTSSTSPSGNHRPVHLTRSVRRDSGGIIGRWEFL